MVFAFIFFNNIVTSVRTQNPIMSLECIIIIIE